MDYLPWRHDRNDDALAYIARLPESIDDDSFKILEDKSIAGWWPEEVVCCFGSVIGLRRA